MSHHHHHAATHRPIAEQWPDARTQVIRLGLLVPRAVCGATFEGGFGVCVRPPDHRGDHRDRAGVVFEAADADQERAR